jgi:hypothetical protein
VKEPFSSYKNLPFSAEVNPKLPQSPLNPCKFQPMDVGKPGLPRHAAPNSSTFSPWMGVLRPLDFKDEIQGSAFFWFVFFTIKKMNRRTKKREPKRIAKDIFLNAYLTF